MLMIALIDDNDNDNEDDNVNNKKTLIK